jgi:hypothetical protein
VVDELKAQRNLKHSLTADISNMVIGPIDNLSEEISIKQSDSEVAQSQAAINSAKITQLEKELKQARELQKLLKKLR